MYVFVIFHRTNPEVQEWRFTSLECSIRAKSNAIARKRQNKSSTAKKSSTENEMDANLHVAASTTVDTMLESSKPPLRTLSDGQSQGCCLDPNSFTDK